MKLNVGDVRLLCVMCLELLYAHMLVPRGKLGGGNIDQWLTFELYLFTSKAISFTSSHKDARSNPTFEYVPSRSKNIVIHV